MKNWITVREVGCDWREHHDIEKHINTRYIKIVKEYGEAHGSRLTKILFGYGGEMIVRGSCDDILKEIEEAQS